MPDIFGAPGLALVMVAVEKLARLGIASLVAVSVSVAVLVAVLVAVHLATHPINNGELTHLVHVHDPIHVSVFVHVISRYLHRFIVFVLVFYYALE